MDRSHIHTMERLTTAMMKLIFGCIVLSQAYRLHGARRKARSAPCRCVSLKSYRIMSDEASKEPWITDISVTKSIAYIQRIRMWGIGEGDSSGKEPSDDGTGIEEDGRGR